MLAHFTLFPIKQTTPKRHISNFPKLKQSLSNTHRKKLRESCTMSAVSLSLPILFLLASASSAEAYDFFYFVLQWPGSYCDTKQSCCFPSTGKPQADFGIHGLWPNNNDGSYPSNCDPSKPFDESKVQGLLRNLQSHWPTLACPSNDGTNFWAHEWEKHGTCAESVFDEYGYFKAALDLKIQLNLLQSLNSTGIHPNGGSYGLSSIKQAIARGTGYTPYIECNVDESGTSQLYQVYFCVDNSGSQLLECPIFPRGKCGSQIEFPSF